MEALFVRQIEIYEYTNKILVILLCVFVYLPTKPLFGPNKYTYDGMKKKNICRDGKRRFVNLCICVFNNKITALLVSDAPILD